jgi:hypothetical protein
MAVPWSSLAPGIGGDCFERSTVTANSPKLAGLPGSNSFILFSGRPPPRPTLSVDSEPYSVAPVRPATKAASSAWS